MDKNLVKIRGGRQAFNPPFKIQEGGYDPSPPPCLTPLSYSINRNIIHCYPCDTDDSS